MTLPPYGVASLALVLAILAGSPSVAAAPVRHVVMEWSRDDPSCLGEAELTSMVERTLGRPVFHSDAMAFAKVSGAVGRAGPDAFEARVALLDKDGRALARRTLTTPGECGRLDESVAVVVTLMIDGVEEEPTPLHIPAMPPRPVARSAVETVPPAPAAPLALTLGLGAGLSSSLLPGVAASFGVRGEAAFGRFVPIAMTLRVHEPSLAVVAGVGGRFSAWTAEVAACPAWSRGRLRLGGCVGLGGGAIEGDYVNLTAGESHVQPLFLATLSPLVAAVRLVGPLWARAEGGAWFPLVRERWGYLDARGDFEQVFRPAPVVPEGTLTLELRAGP